MTRQFLHGVIGVCLKFAAFRLFLFVYVCVLEVFMPEKSFQSVILSIQACPKLVRINIPRPKANFLSPLAPSIKQRFFLDPEGCRQILSHRPPLFPFESGHLFPFNFSNGPLFFFRYCLLPPVSMGTNNKGDGRRAGGGWGAIREDIFPW